MLYYTCPMKRECCHEEHFVRYAADVDPAGPTAADKAYDAMLTHLAEVHGVSGPEANHLVHQSLRDSAAVA